MIEIVSSSCSSQLAGRAGDGAGQELLVRVRRDAGVVTADHGHPGQVERLGDRLERRVEQQVPRAAVPQDVPDLGAGQAVVDRDEDPARRGHAEMGLEHGRRVEQQRGDAVSLGQARRPERVGEPPRPFGQFPVAVPPLAVHDGDLVRVHVRGPVQEIDRVQFRTEHGARRRAGSGPTGARRSAPLIICLLRGCTSRLRRLEQDSRVHDPGRVELGLRAAERAGEQLAAPRAGTSGDGRARRRGGG